ncbi:hypothetical protein CDD80_3168 [Ophiocordyceps camponoti-rufipedis]|uniref:Uncharacterized protein n=1 Tax=Ophiocordyceps camponoti-rufipedis TaxID=2004952 RepID=A0A2C5XJ64_9HYPO|nr:hypothetical protein CDD80_3168 [Ophiocordyceps camponoti-rufipedis]
MAAQTQILNGHLPPGWDPEGLPRNDEIPSFIGHQDRHHRLPSRNISHVAMPTSFLLPILLSLPVSLASALELLYIGAAVQQESVAHQREDCLHHAEAFFTKDCPERPIENSGGDCTSLRRIAKEACLTNQVMQASCNNTQDKSACRVRADCWVQLVRILLTQCFSDKSFLAGCMTYIQLAMITCREAGVADGEPEQ